MNRKPRWRTSLVCLLASVGVVAGFPSIAAIFPTAAAANGREPSPDVMMASAIAARHEPTETPPAHVRYRVPNPTAHAAEKVEANARANAARAGAVADAAPLAVDSISRNWQGVNDTSGGPSDTTGAIGTTRYMELVNRKYAIYNRTSDVPLGQGSLDDLFGLPGFENFDPQVIWDPTTQRFYFAGVSVASVTENYLAFGFSTTASPNSASDFCNYAIGYGSDLPDYPKLGDTTELLLVGVNAFDGPTEVFLGSDVISVTKPPTGTSCPTPSTFVVDVHLNLANPQGGDAFTPVPANQTDPSSTGYVVAEDRTFRNSIDVYTVTKNPDNTITVAPGRQMSAAAFSTPANAPQKNTARVLDTLDGRLTQAVSAIDPAQGATAVAIWTQHTVFGGAGSEVRWYEINPVPATPVPFKTGKQTDAALFNFNAAIAPDRRVNGANRNFGSKHMLFFNTSSVTEFVDIRASASNGIVGVSASTLLKDSTSQLDDFTCDGTNLCRWGDYSAATPDPASLTTEATGAVWGTNAFTDNGTPGLMSDWRTQNFAAQPK